MHQAAQLRVDFLLCTEVFFNEWARHYRRAGAHLIAVPRSSGQSVEQWHVAGAMAALVSGCYVVSSNRVGAASEGPELGGRGFAFAPDGSLIGQTSGPAPVLTFELELAAVSAQQRRYPCSVAEIGSSIDNTTERPAADSS